ncbi:MAG: methylenetetrahydrofolate reductase [NAD(P)H] [Planctomycetes bacterium]|nr:methylenetetrahydrofolate reductase [NAD(P)H] [Planctomycetota bacterium]
MHLAQILAGPSMSASFEYFPPRTEAGWGALFATIAECEALAPSFVSVTYGAGGSTRAQTHDLVVRLRRDTSLDPMPHLTCVGHSAAEIDGILARYAEAGVSNVLALRGDPQPGGADGDFAHAADLVTAIQRFNDAGRHGAGTRFGVAVAGFPEGHPQTPNTLTQMDHLKAKVDAGADAIITQLFFDNHAFHDWRERCELAGIRVPIVAGIMPVTSLSGLRRMADLAAGTRYPAKLLRALARAGSDDEAVARVGTHWATEQCRDLIDAGVAGLHFYTLNKSASTRRIYETLGARTSAQLRPG